MSRSKLICALAVLALSGCDGWPGTSRELTVVGWGGASQTAHREAYWRSFSQQTGIPLREDSWNGGIDVLRAKAHGGNPDWDVVQVEVEELLIGCEEGLFERLDWAALGGRDAFIPTAVNDCGVGAMGWSELFAYDASRLKGTPLNWADFWDTRRFPGRRGLRKSPKYTLEAALMADGVEPVEVYAVLATPEGVERAFRKLDALKPEIHWVASVTQVPQLLASGTVALSMATPGVLILANRVSGRNFKVVWDENIYAVDFWAILNGSPKAQQALRLVQYMTQPENEVRLPLFIPTGLSNKQAITALDAPFKRDTPSNPDNLRHALQLDARFWMQHSDSLTRRFNTWASAEKEK